MVALKEREPRWLSGNPRIQQECADKTEERETGCVLLAGHLNTRIHRSNAIDESLNRTTACALSDSVMPRLFPRRRGLLYLSRRQYAAHNWRVHLVLALAYIAVVILHL